MKGMEAIVLNPYSGICIVVHYIGLTLTTLISSIVKGSSFSSLSLPCSFTNSRNSNSEQENITQTQLQ